MEIVYHTNRNICQKAQKSWVYEDPLAWIALWDLFLPLKSSAFYMKYKSQVQNSYSF